MKRQLGFSILLAILTIIGGSFDMSSALGKGAEESKNCSNHEQIVLVDAGQSPYTIVAADHPLPVKFAAEELQKYLEQMSGVRLPIASKAQSGTIIYVGDSGMAGSERDKLLADLKGLGEDGYVMRSLGQRLILAGNSPRATLYAVYHFLEKHLGCGWCIPRDDTVPRRDAIRLTTFDDVVGPPAFTMRKIVLFPYGLAPIYGGEFMKTHNLPQIDWMAKNRFNWAHPAPNGPGRWENNHSREILVPEVEKRGLNLEVGGHSFNTFLPADRFGKEHPEYYALKADGTRAATADRNGFVCLCLSHPDVARQMAENISQWLDENPEVDCVDLWHDDQTVEDYCHCPKCSQVSEGGTKAEAQAAYAKSYVRFTNQVAALVAKSHPKVLINALMYKQTLNCPAGAQPFDDNVLVGVALYPRYIQKKMRPLETSKQDIDSNLRLQFPAWQKYAKHFYLYEYYTLSDQEKFWSFASMIRDDMRYFRRCGVDGISSDQHVAGKWYPLNMYAYARLAWNPDLTIEEIVKDFCDRYYGEASESMNAYWNMLEEGLRESWRSDAPIDWRDQQRVVQIRKALSEAENPTIKQRIRATAAMHHLTVSE